MNSMTRRRFLEDSLIAAAVAATAGRPSEPLVAQEKTSRSPNQRLNIAVIGVHGRGQDHARAYAARGDCEVIYACDADKSVGEAFAAKFENPGGRRVRFVQDMRKALDDKSVDVVSIATPDHWHSLAAIWAMQAGKDVYVEKPVSHNLIEGRRMVEASRKYGRICQGGHQYRSLGANRAAAQYIREGKLGKIKLARCIMYRARNPIGPPGSYQPPPSVDYNLWAGPAPMAPITRRSFHYDWHWFWDFGNGEIANNNVHVVDTMRLILGLGGMGNGVMCYGGRQYHDAGQTANTHVAIHDFGELTVVQEVRNLKTAPPRFGGAILLAGSEGYLAGTLSSNTVYDPAGKLVQKIEGQGNEDHFANFLKAVRSRKREDQNADILQGHLSATLFHAALVSYKLGRKAAPAEIVRQLETVKANENVLENFEGVRKHLADNGLDIERERLTLGPWLRTDVEKERFVDNAAADALLTREYRKPFVLPEIV